MTQLVIAAISLALALISGISLATWAKWGFQALPFGIAVFLVSWFGAHLIILTPMSMWKELRDKLSSYEDVCLVMFYDDANPTCKRDTYEDSRLTERLWRVGVKASKGKLEKGVLVRLEEIEPAITDLPQVLHPMSSRWTGAPMGLWEGDGSFDLRPGDTEYIDVLRYKAAAMDLGKVIGKESLELVLQTYPKAVELRSHKLTLTTRSENAQALTVHFMFELNRDGLMRFYPL